MAFAGFVQIANGHPQWTGRVEPIESKLEEPLHWRTPRRIFVNSMSDLFHENLTFEAIDRIFAMMALCPQHTFQILTKRAELMHEYLTGPRREGCTSGYIRDYFQRPARYFPKLFNKLPLDNFAPLTWPLPNVWLGVSAEDQQRADERIPWLLKTPAAVRFVSYEPALGPVHFERWLKGQCPQCHGFDDYCADVALCETCQGLNRLGIDWLIVGGESGPGARPFDIAWARSAVAQCRDAGVAVLCKQLGAKPTQGNTNGNCHDPECTHPDCGWVRLPLKDRKGGDMAEWSPDLRVRLYPTERQDHTEQRQPAVLGRQNATVCEPVGWETNK